MSADDQDRLALDRDVADWRAKLHGDKSGSVRRAYDAWLAEDPGRREADAAYRGAETDACLTSLPVPPLLVPTPVWRTAHGRWAAMAATLLVMGALGFVVHHNQAALAPGTDYAGAGAIRSYPLEGGVDMILDRNALIRTQADTVRPALLMLGGRARFSIASRSEPFTVSLDMLSVRSRRATFDVEQTNGAIRVIDLAGAVDIDGQASSQQPGAVVHLVSGMTFVRDSRGKRVEKTGRDDGKWTTAMLPLDGMTLGEVIAIGNQAGGTPIVLGDPTLAPMKLQGQLSAIDTDTLAHQLAAAFDLDLARGPAAFVLTRKK